MPFVPDSLILSLSLSICTAWAKLCHGTLFERYSILPVRRNLCWEINTSLCASPWSLVMQNGLHTPRDWRERFECAAARVPLFPCGLDGSLSASFHATHFYPTALRSLLPHHLPIDLFFPSQTPFSSHSHRVYSCPNYVTCLNQKERHSVCFLKRKQVLSSETL